MVSKKPKKIDSSFGLGNLTFFGFNIDELIKNLSGHSLEELAKNPKLAQEIKEQLQKEHPGTQSFEKKFGNVSVSYRVTRRGLGTPGDTKKVKPKITKTLTITKDPEDVEKQLKEKEEHDKEWREEEEKLFGKKTKKRKK